MENDSYIVIEGVHKNPNNIDTIDESTNCLLYTSPSPRD